jgi:hypothetical protein
MLEGNADALRGMDSSDVETLTKLLRRVIANLSDQAEPRP